jgi:hypothetical protein
MSLYSTTQTFEFQFSELHVTPGDLEHLLGITPENRLEPFQQYIDEVLEVAQNMKNIRGSIFLFDQIFPDTERNTTTINGVVFETGKIVTRQIRNASGAAIFVCTAGSELEEFSKAQMKIGNIPEGYVADMAGSVIVEAAMDKIQERLSEEKKMTGLKITNRYSPGYCGWRVDEQQKLFSLLPEKTCNIRLTESSLMLPIKSVSGIIGIGSEVRFNPYTCNICEMDQCIYRNKKNTR